MTTTSGTRRRTRLWASRPDLVGTATSGETALANLDTRQPEVVLMDLAMPGIGGLEAIRRLRSDGAQVGVIASSLDEAGELEAAAITAGARQLVCKTDSAAQSLPAIYQVAAECRRLAPG